MPVIPLPQPEPAKWKSLALALLVHALLIGALFFGVQWKSQAPSAIEVEMWSPPPPRREAAPRPSQPEKRPEPEAKPEPKPVVKADIELKDDKKKLKKTEEPKPELKKLEPQKEPPKKEEPKKPEPKKEEPKREEPDWKKELAREQKQLDQQKAVQDQRARAAAEANQLNQLKAEQASAARNRGLVSYIGKIAGKIRGNIVLPPGIQGNPLSEFEVTQLPSGEVLGVKVRKSSGNPVLDAAIERAILKSSPLPKPDQPELFERVLRIPYRPLDE